MYTAGIIAQCVAQLYIKVSTIGANLNDIHDIVTAYLQSQLVPFGFA